MHAWAKKVARKFAFTAPAADSNARAVHTPLSRQTLQLAVRAFVDRLVDKTVFSCERCGTIDTAPAVIFDATCIAPAKALSCDPILRQFGDLVKHGSEHANRVLIPDVKTREHLYRFCGRPVVKSEGKAPTFSQQASCSVAVAS